MFLRPRSFLLPRVTLPNPHHPSSSPSEPEQTSYDTFSCQCAGDVAKFEKNMEVGMVNGHLLPTSECERSLVNQRTVDQVLCWTTESVWCSVFYYCCSTTRGQALTPHRHPNPNLNPNPTLTLTLTTPTHAPDDTFFP
jgi:hypothetical protein